MPNQTVDEALAEVRSYDANTSNMSEAAWLRYDAARTLADEVKRLRGLFDLPNREQEWPLLGVLANAAALLQATGGELGFGLSIVLRTFAGQAEQALQATKAAKEEEK